MSHRYFRAGIGSVIYTSTGEVAFFRRAKPPVGIWQFQQGGIDLNEAPIDALWRELKEETGLTNSSLTLTATFPTWTTYTDPHAQIDSSIERIGQVHQWYFLRLHDETIINLGEATDAEFDAWKFVSFVDAIQATSSHKQHVYQALHDFFVTEVFKD